MKRESKKIINIIYLIIILIILAGCSNNNESKKIEYQILFKGFVTLNEFNQPSGAEKCLVFTDEKDWIDFCDKYFGSFPSVISEINNRAIDFKKENLVFIYSLGPRQSFDSFTDIKYLLKDGNGFKAEYDTKKVTDDTIYVLNNETSKNSLTKHALVFLLSVKPDDVPKNS